MLSFALPIPAQTDGAVSLPIGLFLAVGRRLRRSECSRLDRFGHGARTVSASSTGWRELPPGAVPERDVLPALTLAASAEHPLVLELHPANTEAATAVHVAAADRGRHDRRRIGELPCPLPASTLLDSDCGSAVPGVSWPESDGRGIGAGRIGADQPGRWLRRFRVTLPESAARSAVLELSYTLPGSRHVFGETVYQPPLLAATSYTGPIRWLITEPSDAAPLWFGNHGRAEIPGTFAASPMRRLRLPVPRWIAGLALALNRRPATPQPRRKANRSSCVRATRHRCAFFACRGWRWSLAVRSCPRS